MFLEQYKKDVKYYIGQEFVVPAEILEILDDYEEFLKINQGFVAVAKAEDLKLPANIKPIIEEEELLAKIESVIQTGNFKPMIDCYLMVK